MRTKTLHQTDAYDKNADKCQGNEEPCARCGKPVHNPAGFVHLIDGGGVILHPGDEDNYEADGGDTGFHPVGSECIKTLRGWTHEA